MSTPIPVVDNPLDLFNEWLEEAVEKSGLRNPTAFSLATVDESGQPDARMLLLKGVSQGGFVFYTNFRSAKARQLFASRKAGMCFYWESLERQVRIRGTIEEVTPEEADAYFATRPRLSQLGAWASEQSREIPSRATLEQRLADLEQEYAGQDVPRPPHWSGFRVLPSEIEFWKEGSFRLHDRLLYRRAGNGGWKTAWLSP